MDFAHFSRLLSVLFTPSDFLWLLLVVGILLQWTRRKRLGKGLVIAVAVVLGFVLFLPIDRWLAAPLENALPRHPLPSQVDGILVLGGGEDGEIFAARHVQAPDPAEGRLIASAELARRYPHAKLIFSGGMAAYAKGALPEASVARAIYAQMGLPPDRMIAENRSRNTWENFLYSKELARPRPGQIWVVVTSAVHMPRAMGIAAKLHWHVLPWPADYMSTGRAEGESWSDSLGSKLDHLESVVHEWAGLAVYRLTGRWASTA